MDLQKNAEFEKEAVPHMDILYNYALRMTSNRDDAADLVQETFLKAFRFWDKYEKGTNIRAWLFRIMKNSYINKYRKETKEPDTVDYDDIQNFYNTIKADSADPNDLQRKIFGGLLEDDIARALEALPEEFRTVVILGVRRLPDRDGAFPPPQGAEDPSRQAPELRAQARICRRFRRLTIPPRRPPMTHANGY
jgi:RNA polymerase sigma-70 factor (ECF subfamily)